MAYKSSKFFTCKACGLEVCWAVSKAGKKYLAQPFTWGGEYAQCLILPGHKCTPNPTWQAAHAEAEALRVANAQEQGQIIPGVTVEVVKGRKVAHGTRGVVFWHGNNGYGMSVGMRTADGEKVFTAATNVKVLATV
jgi:hypothetical protein